MTSLSPSGTGGRGDQFTLWFAANANVVNFTLGGLAIEWSAINRVDYYQVKSGRYEARSSFTPDGYTGGSGGGPAFATSSRSQCRYRS
jgi:hypothetical protein